MTLTWLRHLGTKCCLSTLLWSLATWIVVYQMLSPSRAEISTRQHLERRNGSPEFAISQPNVVTMGSRDSPAKRAQRKEKLRNSTRSRSEDEAKLHRLKKLANLLFPSKEFAMDGSKVDHSEIGYYSPGREWKDIAGNPIQAHGGGIIYVSDSQTFYWYGENKAGRTYHLGKHGTARVDVVGISCYASKDLWTWKFEGLALKGEKRDRTSDLYVKNVVERPKVIYNDRTNLYVMWMHIDNGNYSKAAVGVAVSTRPTGPFEYLGSKRPHGCDSRDMTVFKDDNGDAYLVYSSQANNELHVGTLTEDYLDVVERGMQKILVKQRREAPIVFKHRDVYYMLSSGCTSWNPNGALIHASDSMLGPWFTVGDPCVGGKEELRSLTFFSQGSFVLPLPGLQGTFIYMGDRWLPANLRDSRYVWLPLTMDGPSALDSSIDLKLQRVSIHWADKWKLLTAGTTRSTDSVGDHFIFRAKSLEAFLFVLHGPLWVQGGISDLPQRIEIQPGFVRLMQWAVNNKRYGLWSKCFLKHLQSFCDKFSPRTLSQGFTFKQEHPLFPGAAMSQFPAEIVNLLLYNPCMRSLFTDSRSTIVKIDPFNYRHLSRRPGFIHFRDVSRT